MGPAKSNNVQKFFCSLQYCNIALQNMQLYILYVVHYTVYCINCYRYKFTVRIVVPIVLEGMCVLCVDNMCFETQFLEPPPSPHPSYQICGQQVGRWQVPGTLPARSNGSGVGGNGQIDGLYASDAYYADASAIMRIVLPTKQCSLTIKVQMIFLKDNLIKLILLKMCKNGQFSKWKVFVCVKDRLRTKYTISRQE